MKKAGSKLRRLMALGVIVLTLFLILFIFFATKSAMDVWDRLQSVPEPLFYTYMVLIGALILGSIWLVYKLLKPTKLGPDFEREAISQERILKELDHAEDTGMETADLRREIEHLQERKAAGSIYVALFGDVSTGKSSIIKTLLPDSLAEKKQIDINVQGGSTQDIAQYTWKSSSGDKLILTDLPGRNEAQGSLDAMAQDEAIRAQVVIYVTDSDLSRSQFEDIQQLKSFGKPMIVALNKSDRFNDEEKTLIHTRFDEHFSDEKNSTEGSKKSSAKKIQLVFIQSGGEEEILKIYPDGREETVIRERKADIDNLASALQTEIDSQSELLENLRDASVFVLVKQKLDSAKVEFRNDKAEAIIKSSTRKAVLGALAALSPGSDLVIQGVLGTQMVKQLCSLYDVPVRQLDIDKLLEFSSGQLKKSTPILLAVAGNGMKAFPGIGTVTGGLTHAVAYGLIFDALGHAITKTLQQRGKLQAAPTALTFKEMLSENLETRAKIFAKLVLDSKSKE
ncbi:MAG TPA: GTP-binding protein [Leucothrix mucor]|nr:GTP-binding protein [Leucothrix mucor]